MDRRPLQRYAKKKFKKMADNIMLFFFLKIVGNSSEGVLHFFFVWLELSHIPQSCQKYSTFYFHAKINTITRHDRELSFLDLMRVRCLSVLIKRHNFYFCDACMYFYFLIQSMHICI